ncbi:MAG: HAD hydrolase-like protein [Thermoanaerobaculia bacterium]|nr:HAD hydrolase-like protein [Thermoanaerobaculia bacterium]
MRRLLLFDIDGTLLRCGRQVRRIFATALQETYGTTGDLDGYSFAGKIDPQIVFELLSGAGVPQPQIEQGLMSMQERYLTRLERELDATEMVTLPGVESALTSLATDSNTTLGLLTGNWQRGAYTKLARLGLDTYFATGAFGDDGTQRPHLLPVALERARESTGHHFGPEQTVIIGDSLHDVSCGLAHAVPVLGVSTGWNSCDQLAAAGATWVADSLQDGLDQLG